MVNFDIEILQQMGERFNPLPTSDVYLDTRYDWQKESNGAEWPYYRFFYHVAKWLKPELVVELGGWQGTAAAHFAAGHRGNLIYSIDHHSDPGDEYHQSLMRDATNHYANMYYAQGWTTPQFAEREKGKHDRDVGEAYTGLQYYYGQKKLSIDILFIDSWHTYENAMIDWEMYSLLLSDNALVICDDIQSGEIKDAPISGMMRFWDEMPEPKFLNDNLHPGTEMGFVKYDR